MEMGETHSFPTLACSSALMALGTDLLSTFKEHHGIQSKTYGFEVLLGLGLGLSVASSTLAAVVNSEFCDHAISQGIIAQARVFDGSVGIAASTAILGVMAEHESLASPLIAQRKAYSEACSKIMWVSSVIACVGFLLTAGTFQRGKATALIES